MYTIRALSHTADVRFRLSGTSRVALFSAGLQVLANTMKEGTCRKGGVYPVSVDIAIEAPDITCLLIDFLSEVLTRSCTDRVLFCEASFHELNSTNLRASVRGINVTEFDEEIKAVTFHEADVRQQADGTWETRLVFDI